MPLVNVDLKKQICCGVSRFALLTLLCLITYYVNLTGFLALLHAVNMAIGIVETNSNQVNTSFSLKRFPYPPYIDDPFIGEHV